MRIEGTVALVTGGASGLGRATAEGLVAAGARVVLADLASSDGVAVADALGDAARFVPTDVTSEDDVARALDAADALGGARVVVSCAGIVLAQRVLGKSGVRKMPGAIVMTRIRCCARSRASGSVRPATPALEAA